MKAVIVAYPKKEIALKLRALLESEGFHVSFVCALGSSVLNIAQDISEGVVVCASNLSDMTACDIAEELPFGFDIIALSSNGRESYMHNLTNLPLPINKDELLQTLYLLVNSRRYSDGPDKKKSELISAAKQALMKNNGLSETQAHKILQNKSMKSGRKITELAKEIINNSTD